MKTKMNLTSVATALTQFKSNGRSLALAPAHGEIIGARLMKRVNVGAPDDVRMLSVAQAESPEYSEQDWIAKTPDGAGRLRFGLYREAPYTVLIRKVRSAISLLSLRCQYGIEGENIDIPILGEMSHCCVIQQLLQGHQKSLRSEFFGEFKLPENTDRIRSAIAWNAPPLLKLICARLFLGTTAVHGGNVLIDAQAKLYSIDHENVMFTPGSELTNLAVTLSPGSRVRLAALDVAALTSADIENLFSDLPELHWPLGDRAQTVRYYQNRLTTWKQAFIN